jgi:hypothetical protein
MRVAFIGVALVTLAVSAMAEMSVGNFVSKAEELKKKGIFALASSDVGLLKGEMQAVTTAYRDELRAARAAGRPTHSCPPAQSKMDSDEVIAHFRVLPPATGIKAGFYGLMKKKYPCTK